MGMKCKNKKTASKTNLLKLKDTANINLQQKLDIN